MKFPRQDSTKDQLADVRTWATEADLTEAVEWLDAWDSDYTMHLSPQGYIALVKIAREHRCYDADDAIHHRHTGRLERRLDDAYGRKGRA